MIYYQIYIYISNIHILGRIIPSKVQALMVPQQGRWMTFREQKMYGV